MGNSSLKTKSKYTVKIKSSYTVKTTSSLILIIVGFLVSIPFIIDVMLFDNNYHYIELWPFLRFLGMLVGSSMFLFGFISLMVRNCSGGSSSTAELDLARLRYTVETDSRSKK